jgi:protein-disulfide isomerase
MRAKFGALVVFALLPLFACNKLEGQKLAEIDGKAVDLAEFETTAGKEFFELRRRLYDVEKQKLDEYIGAVLLTREADRRKVSVSTLLDQEVTAKVAPANEEEIKQFYETHKARLHVPFEEVSEQIREFVREKRVQERKILFVSSLRAKANVKTFLTPPRTFRIKLSLADAPSIGAENSLVTLVKFEDFQCPYCKSVQPVFAELLKRYSGKLRIVHKDLPLEAIHPQARQAAEAARCAGDQGKFWQYHDRVYAGSPRATVDDLKAYARDVRLDEASFGSCFSGGKFKAAVALNFNEAAGLGLTGTPAFFINGRELIGAQPLEAFTAIIDEELALAK